VIISKRNEFVELRKSHDKDNADSRNPKPHAWDLMHNLYCSDNDHLLILSSSAAQALLGFSVSPDICRAYDQLDLEQFKAVVNYMVKLYPHSRNKKTVSGEHDHFGVYVGGCEYLLYFYECLKETGDTALMNCAYAELGDNVLRTLSDPPKRRIRRGSSTASQRSISPMIPTHINYCSQKQSAVMATEYAANAFTERQQQSTESKMFDRMIEMSDNVERETAAARQYKLKYRQGKKSGVSEIKLSEIETKYKRVKKKAKIYAMQYKKLKSDLGYKSPEESDGSLSSGSSESNNANTKKRMSG